jgi:hypothetical protein
MLSDRVIIMALAANVEPSPGNGAEVTFSYAGTTAALAEVANLDGQTTAGWISSDGSWRVAAMCMPVSPGPGTSPFRAKPG